MEKKLNFREILSLKESCLRRLTVILWSKPDILHSFDEVDVEDKVKDDVSKLKLPPLLTGQAQNLVRPIGLEIRTWRKFLKNYLSIYDFDISVLKHLCWTTLGTLDYQKMAEKLIRYEIFDSIKPYLLACLFSLDDYIPALYEKLPEINKSAFYNCKGQMRNRHAQPPLYFGWPSILKGERYILDSRVKRKLGSPASFNQYAFEHSADRGNKASTQYFFQKLTNDEREASLFRTTQFAVRHRFEEYDFNYISPRMFPEEKLSETVFYLLSLLNCDQQMEIFKTYPYHIFMCLLDWPWHGYLLDTTGLFVWEILLGIDNDWFLKKISKRITSDNNLSKLFQEFFQLCPSNLRKRFVDRECQSGCFQGFFEVQDSEAIKVIFRNVESVDRKRLVCCEHVFKIFYGLIAKGELSFVELCFQEATLSNEDKEEIKEVYFGFLINIDVENINHREYICEQFLHILDESNEVATIKRNIE